MNRRTLGIAAAVLAVVALALAGALALGGDDDEPREAATATTPGQATQGRETTETTGGETEATQTEDSDRATTGDEEEPEPEPESDPAPEPAPAAAPARYVPFSASTGDWQAELPSGDGWGEPAQTDPRPDGRYRVTVRGPAGAVLQIDYLPSATAQPPGDAESRRQLPQRWFGSMTEYRLGDGSAGYVLNASEAGPGFRILASGGAGKVARRVADSLTFVDL